MAFKVSNNNYPVYVHCETGNYIKYSTSKKTNLQKAQRMASIAIPWILNFNKPFGSVIFMGMNGARFLSCLQETQESRSAADKNKAIFQTALATAAIFGTVFGSVYGMALTSTHDILIGLRDMAQLWQKNEHKKALEKLLQVSNNSLYLTMLLHGGLEIVVLSLATQILMESCKTESLLTKYFTDKKEDQDIWDLIEGFSHLGMIGVRGYQAAPQIKMLQFKYELQKIIASLPENNAVGKLGDKWDFPSDHLPVGAKINDAHIGSWNVLNKHYLEWVSERDSQGLKGSLISKLDQPSKVMQGLTEREVVIIHLILTMMDRPGQPFDALALQECSPLFVQGLMSMLPDHIGVICQDSSFTQEDQSIVLFNKNIFTYLENESFPFVTNVYKSQPKRPIMDIVLQNKISKEKYQLINAHLPGDPNLPGRYEFAHYVLTHQKNDAITIGLGDMNFNQLEMQEAFEASAAKLDIKNPFVNPINNYYTNVGVEKEHKAKIIDHLWTASKNSKLDIKADLPDEVLPGLQKTANLLLPNSKKLKDLYLGPVIDYEKIRNLDWEYYVERIKQWNARLAIFSKSKAVS